MADWRIVTPTRAPMDDEIFGVGYIVLSPGKISIMYSSSDEMLSIMFQNVQPVVRYYYDFLKKEWQDESFSPIDITTVDLTVPESAISSATTKTSYFDLIAFEKGTTACKLAVANEAKTLIRNALISKGVDVPDTTPFRQYAGKVGEISGGDVPAMQIAVAGSATSDNAGEAQISIPTNLLLTNLLIGVIGKSLGSASYQPADPVLLIDGDTELLMQYKYMNSLRGTFYAPIVLDRENKRVSVSFVYNGEPLDGIEVILYGVAPQEASLV